MELILPVCLTLVTILFLKFLFKRRTSTAVNRITKPPPSPPQLPVIGNLHQLGRHPHRSLRSLSLRYGPLMLLRLGRVPVLVVSSADVAIDVMKTHDRAFASRPRSKLFEKLLYDGQDVALAPYGEYWRQMKSVCVLHLLSNKMVRSFQNVRKEEIDLMIETIERAISSSSSSPVNLSGLFTTLTNNVICRVALGRRYSGEEGTLDFKELLRKFTELLGEVVVGDYIPWLAWVDRIRGLDGELEKIGNEFDDFLERVVQDHLDGPRDQEKLDLVDVLLSIQREKTVGFEIDRLKIKAIILDVFVGGTDTSYTLLEWAMTELLRHPECMNKLRDEIRTISRHNLYVSEEDVQEMKYLRAVIKETLRLHPPLPLLVPRESTQDVKLKGYDIAVGTQVMINAWAIGRETATWGPDAEEFRPERFLDSSVDFGGQDFGFIPFGAGRRICPGIAFAVAVDELALASILHRFDWKVAVGPTEGPSGIAESTGIAIHRKFPLIAFASSG